MPPTREEIERLEQLRRFDRTTSEMGARVREYATALRQAEPWPIAGREAAVTVRIRDIALRLEEEAARLEAMGKPTKGLGQPQTGPPPSPSGFTVPDLTMPPSAQPDVARGLVWALAGRRRDEPRCKVDVKGIGDRCMRAAGHPAPHLSPNMSRAEAEAALDAVLADRPPVTPKPSSALEPEEFCAAQAGAPGSFCARYHGHPGAHMTVDKLILEGDPDAPAPAGVIHATDFGAGTVATLHGREGVGAELPGDHMAGEEEKGGES